MVHDSRILFRYGSMDLMRYTKLLNMPLVMLSAGITEVIESSIDILTEQEGEHNEQRAAYPNVEVLSNKFTYDPADGRTNGYETPLSTPGLKHILYYSDRFKQERRKNLIVMGDIMEDAQMADDEKHDTLVRVGFLN